MRLRHWLDASLQRVRTAGLYDSELKLPCTPTVTGKTAEGENELRCVPETSGGDTVVYLDSKCREPAMLRNAGCGDSSGYVVNFVAAPDAACPTLSAFVATTQRADTPKALFSDIGGACTSIPVPDPINLFSVERTSRAAFALLTLVK